MHLEVNFLSLDSVFYETSHFDIRYPSGGSNDLRYTIVVGSEKCLVTKKMIKKNMVLFDKRNYTEVKDWIFDQYPWIAELFNNAKSASNIENPRQDINSPESDEDGKFIEGLIETIETITNYISIFEQFAELHNCLFLDPFRYSYDERKFGFEDPIFGNVEYGQGNQFIARLWKNKFYLNDNLKSANFHLWMAFNFAIRDLTNPERNKKIIPTPSVSFGPLMSLRSDLEQFKKSISEYILSIGLQSSSLFLFRYLKASNVLDEMILNSKLFIESSYQGAFRDVTTGFVEGSSLDRRGDFDLSLKVNIRGKESVVATKSHEPFISLLSRIGVLDLIKMTDEELTQRGWVNWWHHKSTEFIQITEGFKTATYPINHSVPEKPNPAIREILASNVGNIFQDGDGLIHSIDDVDPVEIELTNWNFYQTSKPQSLEEYESFKDEIRKIRMIEDYKRWDQLHGSQSNRIVKNCRDDLIEIMTHLQRRGAQESGALSILLAMSMASLLIFVFQESDLLRNLQVLTSFASTLLLLLAFMLLNSIQSALISLQVDAKVLVKRLNNAIPHNLYLNVKRAAKVQRRIDYCSTFGLCFMGLCLFIVPFQYLTEFYQQLSIGLCIVSFVTYLFWNKTVFDTTTRSIQKLLESKTAHEYMWIIQRWN